jgi:hypothetical protein
MPDLIDESDDDSDNESDDDLIENNDQKNMTDDEDDIDNITGDHLPYKPLMLANCPRFLNKVPKSAWELWIKSCVPYFRKYERVMPISKVLKKTLFSLTFSPSQDFFSADNEVERNTNIALKASSEHSSTPN